MLRQLAGEHPHLAEMITDHAMKPGYDYSDEFEFGLDLILDGLERLRDTRRRTPTRRQTRARRARPRAGRARACANSRRRACVVW
jgi:Tetracyclin repressor-like, C-terminal domain